MEIDYTVNNLVGAIFIAGSVLVTRLDFLCHPPLPAVQSNNIAANILYTQLGSSEYNPHYVFIIYR